jgi:hypothetical protein
MFEGMTDIEASRMAKADQPLPQDGYFTRADSLMGTRNFPHFLEFRHWIGVSEEVKSLIETFEPNRHEFSPEIATYYKDGRQSDRKYYCFHPRHYLDNTIIMEKSSGVVYRGKDMFGNEFSNMDASQHDDTLTLDADVVGDRHFWIAKDFFNLYFFSDPLYEAFQKAKIRGLNFTRTLIDRR